MARGRCRQALGALRGGADAALSHTELLRVSSFSSPGEGLECKEAACFGLSNRSLIFWVLYTKLVFLSVSCLTFQPFNFLLLFLVGSKPETGEERRPEGQCSPHGDRKDPLCAQQLLAVSTGEGNACCAAQRVKKDHFRRDFYLHRASCLSTAFNSSVFSLSSLKCNPNKFIWLTVVL